MANAILYYRDGETGDGYTDVGDLASIDDSQKLEFIADDNLMEQLEVHYTNNVIDLPVPIADGTRKINKQENGLRSIKLIVRGRFRKPHGAGTNTTIVDTDIAKLIAMSKKLQVNTAYPYGIIGFYSPNAPEFSLDPNATSVGATDTPATKGYTIESWNLGYVGSKVKSYDFSVNLSFGGIW
ncbi:MAG: hypothetical protein CL489_11745 [Acidobacteria bacterium]|nr:hypothetical protein [Acidobacteriota bacterium]|tara:strand:- start:103 stop:648 length:546 start_codon:yes stop_codon:yes gene_type:complete